MLGSESLVYISGVDKMAMISFSSLVVMAFGVLAATEMPTQETALTPGATSSKVGVSAKLGTLRSEVTAKTLT